MLARRAHADIFAVKRVVIVEVLDDQRARFRDRRRSQLFARGEKMLDLAKDPRSTLRGTADHQTVRAGQRENVTCAPRRIDVAVRDDWNAHRRLDCANRCVVDGADERAGPRATVHRQCRDADSLGHLGNRDRIARLERRSGADLERHRDVDGIDDRRHDRFGERLVRKQRRSRRDIADLFRGTAHVDIDHLRAARHVVACSIGEHPGIGAGDLHGDRRKFAAMVQAPPRFLGMTQARIGADHLRDRVAGREAFAELAKRSIGDPRHRRHDKSVR